MSRAKKFEDKFFENLNKAYVPEDRIFLRGREQGEPEENIFLRTARLAV